MTKGQRLQMKLKVIRAENANSESRWLWYALIGVCVVFGIVICAIYSPGKFDHSYDRWAQLTILTAGVFGYLLKWGWHYKRRVRFWAIYLTAFLAHCAVVVTVFSRGTWNILLIGIAGSFEVIALAMMVALAMGEKF